MNDRTTASCTAAAPAKTVVIQDWVPVRRKTDRVTSAASSPPVPDAMMTSASPDSPRPIAPVSV